MSLLSLSHTLAHLENSWSSITLDQEKQRKGEKEKERKDEAMKENKTKEIKYHARKGNKAKERKDQERKSLIKLLQWDYLQVPSCIYDFLAIFCIHGI